MTEDVALLRAIESNSGDDTGRLAYADWLDENGEPELAALVRAQVKVYRTPSADPTRTGVRNDEATAWKAYHKKWGPTLKNWGITKGSFHRGLMTGLVWASAANLDALVPWRPGFPVRRVQVHDTDGHATVVAGWALLPCLHGLVIGSHLDTEWRRVEGYGGLQFYEDESRRIDGAVLTELLARRGYAGLRELRAGVLVASREVMAALRAATDLDRDGRELRIAVVNPVAWAERRWDAAAHMFSNVPGHWETFGAQVRRRCGAWFPDTRFEGE